MCYSFTVNDSPMSEGNALVFMGNISHEIFRIHMIHVIDHAIFSTQMDMMSIV